MVSTYLTHCIPAELPPARIEPAASTRQTLGKSSSIEKDYVNMSDDKHDYVNMDKFAVADIPKYINMPGNAMPSDESAPPPPIRSVSIQQGRIG